MSEETTEVTQTETPDPQVEERDILALAFVNRCKELGLDDPGAMAQLVYEKAEGPLLAATTSFVFAGLDGGRTVEELHAAIDTVAANWTAEPKSNALQQLLGGLGDHAGVEVISVP